MHSSTKIIDIEWLVVNAELIIGSFLCVMNFKHHARIIYRPTLRYANDITNCSLITDSQMTVPTGRLHCERFICANACVNSLCETYLDE